MTTDFLTSSAARQHFPDVFNGAATAISVTIARGKERFAVNDAYRLRRHFAQVTMRAVRIGKEDDRWIVSMDHRSFVSEGKTPDEAIDALIDDLREYAGKWAEHYEGASNHQAQWGRVQLVVRSSDGELAAWLRHEAA